MAWKVSKQATAGNGHIIRLESNQTLKVPAMRIKVNHAVTTKILLSDCDDTRDMLHSALVAFWAVCDAINNVGSV